MPRKKKDGPVGGSSSSIVAIRLPSANAIPVMPSSPYMHGPATNMLAEVSTRTKSPNIDPITGTAFAEIKSNADFKVVISGFKSEKLAFKVSTHKLLDTLIILFSRKNSFRGKVSTLSVEIPINEYLQLLGKPETSASLDQLRKEVKNDLRTLFNSSIWFSGTNGEELHMHLLSSAFYSKGKIVANFTPEIAEYLLSSYMLNYCPELLKLDERNSASYHIGRKLQLSWHLNMEASQSRGRRSKAADSDVISVHSLLDAAPDIPSFEEVRNSDRHYQKRIVDVFEAAMSNLETAGIIEWEYCNSGGTVLSDRQASLNYDTFRNLYVKYRFIG